MKDINFLNFSDSFSTENETTQKYLSEILNVGDISLENLNSIILLFGKTYIDLFSNNGFKVYNPVSISSKIDNSVYFIGSPSNTLKSYIKGEKKLSDKGFVIAQPCIRTHNVKKIFTEEEIKWGSTFVELTTLGSLLYGREILSLVLKYFYSLGFTNEDVKIQISSDDKELKKYLEGFNIQIEYDKFDLNYYRHKYGEQNIFGKNFNFQIRKLGTNEFYDVGNFIIIYKNEKEFLIELALGLNILVQMKYGLDHVIDTFPISYLLPVNSKFSEKDIRKLQDCITSFIILYHNGIRIKSSNTRGRIIRSYLNGIYFYTKKLGLRFDKLYEVILNLQDIYRFDEKKSLVSYIKEYFVGLDNKLNKGKNLNKEEQIIKNFFV